MAIFTDEVKSLGTASRDFATITLWEATVSGNINKGQIGEVFADSDFDERPILAGAAATDGASTMPILRAAADQRPVIKPTTNGDTLTVTNIQVHGLMVDGINQTSGIGILITGGDTLLVSDCEVKNCTGDGIKSTARTIILLCLVHNNGGNGIFTTVNQSSVVLCGAAKNDGIGLRHDDGFCDYRSCWSLDNDGDDVKDRDPTDTRFMYISDQSITDQGSLSFPDDIFENQDSSALGFTDFGGDDFTLTAGSILRRMGGLYSQVLLQSSISLKHPQIRFDVAGSSLVPQFGDRFDVGPNQPSLASVAPAAPVITSVTTEDGQVTVNITGDAGKTHEVFFFKAGDTAVASGGTRVGDGAIVVGSLTNGITFTFIALTRASPTYSPPSLCVFATPLAPGAGPIDALDPLQKAIFDALKANAILTAAPLNGNIFDDVPENEVFPYVRIGEFESDQWRTLTRAGETVDVFIHIFSKERGNTEALGIRDAIDQVLGDNISLTVAGFTFNFMLRLGARTITEESTAGRKIRHVICRYQARLQQGS